MGSNEELGVVLMKSFIFALTKQDQLPKEMIFIMKVFSLLQMRRYFK